MSWESCIVLLNSGSTGSFFTGDIVTGTVVLEFKRSQRIQYMEFQVMGVSKAQWSRSMPTMPFIKIYSDRKTVFDIRIDAFKDLNGKNIEPGISTFQFHFLLPPDLPSSFESTIAKVQYSIKITGKAECIFKKHKETTFIVHRALNLNHIEEYLAASITEFDTKFWKSGHFKVVVKTYKAFAAKQQAPFEIIITNEKNVKVDKINIILIQKVKYIVGSGYADEESKVCKIGHRKFSNTVLEKCIMNMEIPQAPPSTKGSNNTMVNISYVFRVEVHFAYHSTVFKDVPVVLTTIPVMHYDFDNYLHIK